MPPLKTRQCFVRSATLEGIRALPVTVEVNVGSGLPGIQIVGLADSSVSEARFRVKLALRASGFTIPAAQIVANLSPSSLRKTGTGFDLAIAVGILVCTGQLDPSFVEKRIFIGEISLDGSVRRVGGLLAYAGLARQEQFELVTGMTEEDLSCLCEDMHLMLGHIADLHERILVKPGDAAVGKTETLDVDYSEIAGEDAAKRALQIAAAGNHNLMMMGPPGAGKTMLAQRLVTIMPSLSRDEALETALVYSVCGLDYMDVLALKRPFRSPHHASSAVGLLGGGSTVHPGEVSLAHHGVLFLDEMPEFSPGVLQQLRQPLESGVISLARANGTYRFPARFLLLAAANPCPCGYLGDPVRKCRCSDTQIERYQNRIGGPLMDRFDLSIAVLRADPHEVLESGSGTSSAKLKEGVDAARAFGAWRRSAKEGAAGKAGEQRLLEEARLSSGTRRSFEELARSFSLSGRGIMRTLSVSRTIADMRESESVDEEDLLEALMYRSQDTAGGNR